MRQNGSQQKRPSRFWARLAIPATPDGGAAHEAVQAVFQRFEHQAKRRRSILRLLLIGLMVLAIFAGTPRQTWAVQFAIVAVYAVFAIGSAYLNLARAPRPSRPRTITMMVVDIAAICLLQLPSAGSYLMLGLLAFLPFFIATQSGRLSAVMSLAAIIGGGLVIVTDAVLRQQMTGLQTTTVLVMLGLLCLISYVISAVQQHRLRSFAELIASRELLLADVMTAEERERRQVAEALHDGPLQTLLAARQDLRDAIGPPNLSAMSPANCVSSPNNCTRRSSRRPAWSPRSAGLPRRWSNAPAPPSSARSTIRTGIARTRCSTAWHANCSPTSPSTPTRAPSKSACATTAPP